MGLSEKRKTNLREINSHKISETEQMRNTGENIWQFLHQLFYEEERVQKNGGHRETHTLSPTSRETKPSHAISSLSESRTTSFRATDVSTIY